MKKIILSLIIFLGLLGVIPVSAAEEKVPVYVFSKDGCSACIQAEEYFAELSEDYPDLFEIYNIVVFDENWQAVSNDRTELLIDVYERFGEDSSKAATPTIVIGDYHTLGLPQDTEEVYDAIMEVKNSKEPVDEVKKLVDEAELNLEDLLVYVHDDMPTVEEKETSGKYDTIIIIGIFVVLIGGMAALVVASKK